MKKALELLFLIALVSNQPLAGAISFRSAPDCPCGGSKRCCVANYAQSSQETPAIPTTGVTQKDLLMVLWQAVRVNAPVAAMDCRIAAAALSDRIPYSIPIFMRDCTYLL